MKKCIICDIEAEYMIKDTSDYYCKDCAEGYFADLKMLLKLEEEAIKLKEVLKEKLASELENHDIQNDSAGEN